MPKFAVHRGQPGETGALTVLLTQDLKRAFRIARDCRAHLYEERRGEWVRLTCEACGHLHMQGPADCPECHGTPATPEDREDHLRRLPCGQQDYLLENGLA